MAADPKSMHDVSKVRALLKNAERLGRDDIALQCRIRIAELAGQQFDDAVESEFWMAVVAAEEFKTATNGKTTRFTRTRQKHGRVGALKCIADWATSDKVHDGFRILLDAGRPDLTGEAIAVRHSDKFAPEVVEMASQKLQAHGVDLNSLRARG